MPDPIAITQALLTPILGVAVAYAINWEDLDLYRDQCTRRIESAYTEEKA